VHDTAASLEQSLTISLFVRCFCSGVLLVGHVGYQLSTAWAGDSGRACVVRSHVGRQVHNVDVRRIARLQSGCSVTARWTLLRQNQLQHAGRSFRLTDSAVSTRL